MFYQVHSAGWSKGHNKKIPLKASITTLTGHLTNWNQVCSTNASDISIALNTLQLFMVFHLQLGQSGIYCAWLSILTTKLQLSEIYASCEHILTWPGHSWFSSSPTQIPWNSVLEFTVLRELECPRVTTTLVQETLAAWEGLLGNAGSLLFHQGELWQASSPRFFFSKLPPGTRNWAPMEVTRNRPFSVMQLLTSTLGVMGVSHTHRMAEVGSELWRPSGPTPCSSRAS